MELGGTEIALGRGHSYNLNSGRVAMIISLPTCKMRTPRGLAPARVSTNSFRNLGGLGLERNFRQIWARRRPFGRSQKFPQILLFSSPTDQPLTSPAYPSLRGYRRAETADGPRRRQSVIHMRAQMLRSIFLARHGSIHGRCAPVRCLPPPVFEICAFPSHKNTLEFSRESSICKFGPEYIRQIYERNLRGFQSKLCRDSALWPGPRRGGAGGERVLYAYLTLSSFFSVCQSLSSLFLFFFRLRLFIR